MSGDTGAHVLQVPKTRRDCRYLMGWSMSKSTIEHEGIEIVRVGEVSLKV